MRFFEMNNIFVYIEMEGGKVADVSLELLTKGRELATTLGVKLEAVVLGHNLAGIEKELAKYGADTVWVADDPLFSPFRTLPHTAVLCGQCLVGSEMCIRDSGGPVRSDRAGETPDRAVRRHARGPRLRTPRIVGPAQRSYGRLHAARNRRPQGRQDGYGV